jgi:Leucine-rich repeat (LRR) protein
MGLTEVPSELFRMKDVKTLVLGNNDLCSLPSEITLLATLELLFVRSSKRSGHDLTTCFRSPATCSRLFRLSSVC